MRSALATDVAGSGDGSRRDDVAADVGSAGGGLAGALAVLAAALEAHDVGVLSEAELVDATAALSDSKAWIDAHVATLVAAVARRRGGPTDEEAATEAALDAAGPLRSGREPKPYFWERQVLGARLRLSEWEARRLVSTSVALDGRLPNTKSALVAGEVSWRHAEALAAKTVALPDDLAGQVECAVLSDRRLVTAKQYGNRAAQLADQLQPPPEREPRVRSASAWELADGSVAVAATLDAEGGRTVARAVEAYGIPFGPDDTRAQSERWADALVEISRVALDHLDPTLANRHPLGRPHLMLTAGLTGLAPAVAASSGQATGPVILDGAGYLTATHITRAAADRLLCDAAVSVVTHCAGKLVSGEQASQPRMPNRRERRALAARDRGCRFPGCTRPAHRCHPHHVIFWADGGPTTPENLVSLCPEHHRTVHDDGWDLIFDGRTATFTDPYGRVYESPPPLVEEPPWSGPPDEPFIGQAWIRAARPPTSTKPPVPQVIPPDLPLTPTCTDEPPF